jgi:hypothetical protein
MHWFILAYKRVEKGGMDICKTLVHKWLTTQ